jgi:hypothetical protein
VIEAIKLGSLTPAEATVSVDWTEKACGWWSVDSFEERQEDEADGISLRQELVASRAGKLGDQAFRSELGE